MKKNILKAHEEEYLESPRMKTKDITPMKECIKKETIQHSRAQYHGSGVRRELNLGPLQKSCARRH